MGKSEVRLTQGTALAIIAILAVGGFGWSAGWFDKDVPATPLSVAGGNAPAGQPVVVTSSACPDDGITTVYAKLQDDGAATETYITGTLSGTPSSGNLIFFDETTGTILAEKNSSSSAWVSTDMDCGHKVKVYAVSNAGVSGSAISDSVELAGNTKYLTLHSNGLSKMTIKVKDVLGDDWEYLFADGVVAGTNSTTGVDMNTTSVTEDEAATALAIGSDGYFDLELYVKSATSRYYANEKGKPMYLCADLGGATNGQEWDATTVKVTVDGGSALPNVKSQIDADSLDYIYLQDSEVCYNVGDLDDSYTTIGFYVKAKSGMDPDATDDDVNLCFLGEGSYKAADVSNTIKRGVYTDASSQAAVIATSIEVPKVVLQVS